MCGGRVEEPSIILWTLILVGSLNGLAITASYALVLWPPSRQKIQKRSYTLKTLNSRMPIIGLNLLILVGITIGSLSVFGDFFTWEEQSVWTTTWQVILISLVDDAFFYGFHRTLHQNKWLYKKIHLIHHKAYTPVPIEYIYVHPLEWMGGSIGIILGLGVLLVITGGPLSAVTFLVYSGLRNFHELDIHSGLKSKWLCRALPFVGAAEHHDMHHSKPHSGNYGSTYVFWDHLFGTRAPMQPEQNK